MPFSRVLTALTEVLTWDVHSNDPRMSTRYPSRKLHLWADFLGVSQRPLTLILLEKHRDTNGSRIMIQIGGVYVRLSAKRTPILLQKYRDRNGRCGAMLFKSIGVRGRCDSPDLNFCC